MPRFVTRVAALLVLALVFAGAQALAQGVAPGGGIGNSTGIGSGLGGVIGGTGPSYPNGTTAPSLSPPPPPGGYGGTLSAPSGSPPPGASSSRPSYYPQPQEPFVSTAPRSPSTLPLSLPERPSGDLSFLKGCWRSDVFQHAQHPGTSTWCFDEKGAGRFLYSRQDQAGYFCRGPAEARYNGQQLRLHITSTTCSDKNDSYPTDLDCKEGGDGAQCGSPGTQAGAVRLYRVR